GLVRTWDATTYQLMRTFTGHTDIVFSVAWSPDGTRLASASGDKTVRVWDVATGQTVSTFQSNDRLFAVAWSPDGMELAYGGSEGVLQSANAPPLPTAAPTPSAGISYVWLPHSHTTPDS